MRLKSLRELPRKAAAGEITGTASALARPSRKCAAQRFGNEPGLSTNGRVDNFVGRVSALLPTIAHSVAGRLVAQVSYGSVPPRSRDEARANPSTAGSAGTSWSTTQQAFEAGVLDELGYP
jgi:hypothetical protein